MDVREGETGKTEVEGKGGKPEARRPDGGRWGERRDPPLGDNVSQVP